MELFILKKEHLQKAGIEAEFPQADNPIPMGKYSSKDGYALTEVVRQRTASFLPMPVFVGRLTDGREMFLPGNLVELLEKFTVQTTLEELEESMQARYGNNAWLERHNRRGYIFYPEIAISNTLERKHVVKDLLVTFSFTVDPMGRDITRISGIKGRRFTVNLKELAVEYFHSHLDQTYATNEFTAFCLGTDTVLSRMTQRDLDSRIPIDAFLHQLDAFVSWESLEGRPHRSLSSIAVDNAGESADFPQQDLIYDGTIIIDVAQELLKALSNSNKAKEFIHTFELGTGPIYLLNLTKEVMTFMTDIVHLLFPNQLREFDTVSMTYANSAGLESKIRTFEGTPTAWNPKASVTYRPRVIKTESDTPSVIKVVHPDLVFKVLQYVNTLLNDAAIYECTTEN